jgi:hypothetical protein
MNLLYSIHQKYQTQNKTKRKRKRKEREGEEGMSVQDVGSDSFTWVKPSTSETTLISGPIASLTRKHMMVQWSILPG